jgi:hypothetical protein
MNDKRTALLGALLAAQTLLAGCAYGYLDTTEDYSPQDYVESQPPGPPVSQYEIPAIAPKGKAFVMSLGPEDRAAPGALPERLLRIRVAVQNDADTVAWTLDPRDMKLAFDGSTTLYPAYSTSEPAGASLVVPPGKRGKLDLFFPIGPEARPLFVDFLWQVHRGDQANTFSTRFDMSNGPVAGEPYYEPAYDTGVVLDYDPGWWWGPDWYWWGPDWYWGTGWWGGRPFVGYHEGFYGGGPRFGGFHRGGFRGGGFGGGFRGGGFHGGGFGGGFHGGGFHGGGFGGGFHGGGFGGGFHGGGFGGGFHGGGHR